MSRAALIGVALVATLALGACDSSDDGGGGDMGPMTGTDTGMNTGNGSGDFAAIVALGEGDEPLALDATSLGTDLSSLFGGGTAEPVGIEDGDTALSLTQRQKEQAIFQ